jgi:hypothetical protein
MVGIDVLSTLGKATLLLGSSTVKAATGLSVSDGNVLTF